MGGLDIGSLLTMLSGLMNQGGGGGGPGMGMGMPGGGQQQQQQSPGFWSRLGRDAMVSYNNGRWGGSSIGGMTQGSQQGQPGGGSITLDQLMQILTLLGGSNAGLPQASSLSSGFTPSYRGYLSTTYPQGPIR